MMSQAAPQKIIHQWRWWNQWIAYLGALRVHIRVNCLYRIGPKRKTLASHCHTSFLSKEGEESKSDPEGKNKGDNNALGSGLENNEEDDDENSEEDEVEQ